MMAVSIGPHKIPSDPLGSGGGVCSIYSLGVKKWENTLYSFENTQIISGSLPQAIGKEFVTLIVYRESRMKLGKELVTVMHVVELKIPFRPA